MDGAVQQVLSRRSRRASRNAEWTSLGLAALLHVVVLAALLGLPGAFAEPPEPLEFVPVAIIPAQALGVPRTRPQPQRPAPKPPEPAPAAEEPAPEPEPEKAAPEPPAPKPPAEDLPVLPAPEKKPAPEKAKPAPEKPRPAAEKPRTEPPKPAAKPSGAQGGSGTPDARPGESDDTGEADGARRGSPTGSRLGTSAFGSEVTGLDPSFTYGYYIDRLLSLIDSNWERPTIGGEVKAVVFFRIEKSGDITDLKVLESSGYNSFDLAALRAVQNAAPFPPLPSSYRSPSLGVNLIVR